MEGMRLIFCEGKVDLIFIADIIEILYGFKYTKIDTGANLKASFEDDKIMIIEIGGIDNLNNSLFINMLEDNIKMNGKNLIFFDADCSVKKNGNKGFENCNNKLNNLKTRASVHFNHHIWPNHNVDGDIEDVLVKLIPPEKKCVFDCIKNHQKCLQSTGLEDVRFNFELKQLLGYYIFTCNEKSDNNLRDYKKSNIWNLDFETIEELKKLKDFLDENL